MNGRIEFILSRDGLEAAISYAKQTLLVYRKALADPNHFATAKKYRRNFIIACIECRDYLRRNKAYYGK